MKKRIISLILCAAVIISACGCSADNGTLSADSSSSAASAASSAETASQDTASSDSGSSYDTSSDTSDKTSSEEQNSSSSDSSDKQNSSSADSSDKQNNSSDASSETSKPSTNKQESSSSAVTSSKPANNTGSATNKPASATAADTTKKPSATTTTKRPSATTTTTTLKQTDDKPLNFSKTYEAENGKLSNDMSIISGGNASGGKSVGKFENDRSYCQIKINVPSDGIYDIVIRSMGIGGSKENDIYTDGKKVGTFTSENNKFSDYTVSAVSLTKGDHNIRIIKSWGWIELDKITVKTGAKISNSTYNVTSSLVNRNATANTKKLYSFLKDSYGKYVITGQQCDGGINGNEFKAIKILPATTPPCSDLI